MLIFALDDEAYLLRTLVRCIKEADETADVREFSRVSAALLEIEGNGARPDVVFSDIEMPGMTGLEFAARMKKTSPKSNVVFVTGYSQYALEAMSLHPSGYVMKPVTAEKVRAELDNLRFAPERGNRRRLRAQCFGNFELFLDGEPMRFRYAKTKELFAYLVDRRGAAADTDELCAALWEDRPDTAAVRSHIRNLTADLSSALAAAGLEHVFIKARNSFSVATEEFDCDYYDFLRGDPAAVNAFFGEYMSRYTWAEFRIGTLIMDGAAKRD